MRYGPSAPWAVQFGKYDTLTSTGTPTWSTWNERSCSSTTTSLTVTAGSATGSIASRGTTMSTCLPRVSGSSALRFGSGTNRLSSTSTWMRCQLVGPVVGGHRGPLVAVLEPARAELEVALALVAVAPVDDDGLHGERLDDVGVGDLEDLPRSARRQQRQLGLRLGRALRLVGAHHHVAHAERLQVRHALGGVVVVVAQLAHRVGALLGHRGRRQEVVRRRARRLEEQPLHRRDAAVGPVRQQHQRHRRAVLAVVARCSPT